MRQCEHQFSRYTVISFISSLITVVLSVLGYSVRSETVLDVATLFAGVSMGLVGVVIVYGRQVVKGKQ